MWTYNLKSALRHDADMSECRRLLRHGSHSFFAASLLLPAEYRQPITALFAFCRVADDAVDLADDPRRGLDSLYRRLDGIYADRPGNTAVDRAFTHVVHEYRIPHRLPAALLEGFEWDVDGRRYETLSDTYAYCARVAGTVGVMMAMLMGVRDKAVLSRACDLGVAMQLTNIARDVGEDARNGRIYLPLGLLRSHGVELDAWMRRPGFNPDIGRSVREILEAADRLYRRAERGIGQLPVGVRPAIFAARSIYAEIGREIERRRYDSVNQRAVVGGRRKLQLLARAIRKAFLRQQCDASPPLKETHFLLDAVSQMP